MIDENAPADITDRLREIHVVDEYGDEAVDPVCAEAADEIEQLPTIIRGLRAEVGKLDFTVQFMAAERMKLLSAIDASGVSPVRDDRSVRPTAAMNEPAPEHVVFRHTVVVENTLRWIYDIDFRAEDVVAAITGDGLVNEARFIARRRWEDDDRPVPTETGSTMWLFAQAIRAASDTSSAGDAADTGELAESNAESSAEEEMFSVRRSTHTMQNGTLTPSWTQNEHDVWIASIADAPVEMFFTRDTAEAWWGRPLEYLGEGRYE